MKLSEAYNNWSQAPRNLVLSAKYRAGVNTVLMKKYGDTDLSAFTKEFTTDLMRRSTAAHELKVQAASALVYTLQWGGDHGHCDRPSFAFSEIVPAKDTCHGARHAETYHGAWHADRSLTDQVPGTRDRSSQPAVEPPIRKGGRPPKAVAQIDPETLTVVKTWPCMAVVDAALGIGKGNVSRAVKKHQKAAGHYWCHAEDTDTYIQELKRKQARRDSGKPISVPGPSDRSDDLTKVSELKKQYETFNQMRPIAKAQPEAQEDKSLSSLHSPQKKFALGGFLDQELFAELERRGWHGYLSRAEIISIGKSQNISI